MNTTPADHLRTSILDVLAQSDRSPATESGLSQETTVQTTPQDLNRRRRVGDAIAALRLIDCADIKALDDDTLVAFDTRETADTQWPDALEAAA